MKRGNVAAYLRVAVGRVKASPSLLLWFALGLALAALAFLFPAEFLVISAGLIGATAGYGHQKVAQRENPVSAMKGRWGLTRMQIVTLSGAVSLAVAFFLFLAGVGALSGFSGRNTFYLAVSFAFYTFAMGSYFFGRHQVSTARRKLDNADPRQIHEWRQASEAEKAEMGLGLALRRLIRISEPSQ